MLKKINFVLLICIICNAAYAVNSLKKDNTLTVMINKPVDEVFLFTIDPKNTPKWINGIEVEETNEWPVRLGTIYKNRGKTGPWAEYKVSKYIKDKEFELIKQDDSTYHVNYSYTEYPNGSTKLVYHEWVTTGEMEEPFTQDTLNKLKQVMGAK
jgi:hypothetical protein